MTPTAPDRKRWRQMNPAERLWLTAKRQREQEYLDWRNADCDFSHILAMSVKHIAAVSHFLFRMGHLVILPRRLAAKLCYTDNQTLHRFGPCPCVQALPGATVLLTRSSIVKQFVTADLLNFQTELSG